MTPENTFLHGRQKRKRSVARSLGKPLENPWRLEMAPMLKTPCQSLARRDPIPKSPCSLAHILLGGALVLAAGCSCERSEEKETSAQAESVESQQKDESQKKKQDSESEDATASKAPEARGHRRPVGPRLVVQPGKGLGAILFGATRETIERQMQAPCDIQTKTRCAYIKQAVDFTLEDGVLVRAKAHLRDRPVPGTGGKQRFGTFRGGMRPRIMLGLHRHVVLEEYGEPRRKETISLPKSETGTVARHFYDGLILEYDRIENGNIVLAAFEVFPSEGEKEGQGS